MNRKGPPAPPDTARAAHIDNLLDEALKQTFPASDAIAIAVEAVHVAHTARSRPRPSTAVVRRRH
jgi:hypothetical protein